MPTYSISLSPKTIAQLLHKPRSAKSMMVKDILEDTGTLAQMLDHYCQDERGTVTDDWFKIHPDTVRLGRNLKGFLTIEFEETADYGCPDMGFEKDHAPEVDFTINLTSGEILFEVPDTSRKYCID